MGMFAIVDSGLFAFSPTSGALEIGFFWLLPGGSCHGVTEGECDKIKFIVMFAFRRLLPPSRRSPFLSEAGFRGRDTLHETATAWVELSYRG